MERKILALVIALIATSSFALYLHNSPGEKKSDEDSFLIWNLEKEAIKALSFSSEKLNVEIRASDDGLGKYWTVKTEKTIPKKDLENPNHRHGPIDRDITLIEDNETTQVRTKEFLLGATGKSFLDALAPLMAKAKVGRIKQDKDEFGFNTPVGRLSIRTSSQTRRYIIGKKAYGSTTRYIEDEGGQAFAVDARPFERLLSADTSFEEKVLFVRQPEELLSFRIFGESAHVFRYIGNQKKGYWVLDGEKEESLLAKNWIETKLLRVASLGFVPKTLVPKNLQILLEFEMEIGDQNRKIKGRFLKKESLMRPLYFLQSDKLRQTVKVKNSEVEDVLAALKTLGYSSRN